MIANMIFGRITMFKPIGYVALAAVSLLAAIAISAPAAAQKMDRCHVGQRVKTPGGLLATVVAANGAGCTIKTDVKNTFIGGTFAAFMLTSVAGSPMRNAPASRDLPLGEYACYGSGQRVLAGLGFKLLPGGRYTDLDDRSPGRYAIAGANIVFTGGHLGGQTGRDIKDRGFTIGAMVSCQKW